MKSFYRATRCGGLLSLVTGLMIWSVLFATVHAEYEYPMGIPNAWISPEVTAPARPGDWTAEVSGYYYIDYTLGSDSGRTFGHPGAPRKTIPSRIPAGSRVEVNGNYGNASNVGTTFITFAGDSENWVAGISGPAWLMGSKDNRASFFGNVLFQGVYACIDNIDNLAGRKGFSISSGAPNKGRVAHYMLLRNFEMRGNSADGDGTALAINGNTDVDGESSDIVIYNGEIHGFGRPTPDDLMPGENVDPDYIACYVGDWCKDVWILDNQMHDVSGAGVQMGANTSATIKIHNVYAGRNHIYRVWSSGMASKTARYIVYSQNEVHDIIPGGSLESGAKSKGITGQYGARDQWLIFNRIYNCNFGILRVSGASDVDSLYCVGNLIYDINSESFQASAYGEAGISNWGAKYFYAIGNTLSNVPQGIIMPALNSVELENNIVSNLNEDGGHHFLAELSGALKDLQIANNIFNQSSGSVKISIPGEVPMNSVQLNASSYGSGNQDVDPQFVNPNSPDFSIASTSPAINKGLPATALKSNVFAKYMADFGVGISFDANGVPRPQEEACDIGALEFVPKGNLGISVPKGLKVEKPPSED